MEETGRSGVSISIARVAKRRGRWHAAFVVEVVIGAGANHASSTSLRLSGYGSASQFSIIDAKPTLNQGAKAASASRLRSAHLSTGMNFHYVYILQSMANPDRFYVGLTDDLHERLRKHNTGEVSHTSKFRPWVIKTAIAFRDRERASAFERYLKSGSGRAFARKHL